MDEKVPVRNICIFVAIVLSLIWVPELLFEDISKLLLGDLLLFIQILSPLLAVVVVRKLIAREGFQDARLGIRGVQAKYWLLAIFLPIVWNSIKGVWLLTQGLYKIDSVSIPPIGSIVGGIFVFFIYTIPEELGWRSYLVQKLLPLGWHPAFILTGIVWFFWHTNFLLGEHSVLGIILLFVNIILLSYIFGWMYVHSKSIWPCALMHFFSNRFQLKSFFKVSDTSSDIQSNFAWFVPLLIITVILFLLSSPSSVRPMREIGEIGNRGE